ncbi:MAG: aminotransferase class III-fold pyridoxal phosphate-dependent enzyme, partial [Holophagae bacterium]|nr:aminotransferase class III-fold pyridoxal phosphate-dependent enzyme [Holophagae bacterium]
AAAALANLEVIEEDGLVEASARTGTLVLERLQMLQREFPKHFYSIHGRGLFISAHLKRPEDDQPDIALADAIVQKAVRRGVLMFPTSRGFFKFVPPLCIDPDAALEAVDVIRQCFVDLKEQT